MEPIPLDLVIAKLTLASGKEDVGRILKLFPVLGQDWVDGWLTDQLRASPTLEACFTCLVARDFLAVWRARDTQALQRFRQLPLFDHFPGVQLVRQQDSASPGQICEWAEQTLARLRPGVDDEKHAYLLDSFAKTLAGAAGRANEPAAQKTEPAAQRAGPADQRAAFTWQAAGWALEAARLYQHLPGGAAGWRESLHLVDDLYRAYAYLNLPAYADAAIRAYEDLLREQDLAERPETRMRLLNALAGLYNAHPGQGHAEHVEQAIDLLQQALALAGWQDVQGFAFLPARLGELQGERRDYSARSLVELGNAYIRRERRERLENITRAIHCYQAGLSITDGVDAPRRLAATRYDLALALRVLAQQTHSREKSRQSIDEGLKNALASLAEYQNFDPPEPPAELLDELGTLYWLAGRFEEAQAYYEQAAARLTAEQQPFMWGQVQTHLGNLVFLQGLTRRRRNPAQDFARALDYYQRAAQAHTRERYPREWSKLENNLGVVLTRLGRYEEARDHLNQALTLRSAESEPEDTRQTWINRGNLEFGLGNWYEAYHDYLEAMKAGEILYEASVTEAGQKAELSDNTRLHQQAAYAAAQLAEQQAAQLPAQEQNWLEIALELLERGKARLLNEALWASAERPAGVKMASWQRFHAAASALRSSRILLEREQDPAVFAAETREREAILEEFRAAREAVRLQAPDFLRDLRWAEIRAAVPDKQTALLVFCVTERGGLAILVRRGADAPRAIDLPELSTSWLADWLEGGPDGLPGWMVASQGQPADPQQPDKPARRPDPRRMEALLADLGRVALGPLPLEQLKAAGVERLILLPTGGLFLAPLHAAPLTKDQRLGGRFQLSQIPSIKMLRDSQRPRAAEPQSERKMLALLAPGVHFDRLMLRKLLLAGQTAAQSQSAGSWAMTNFIQGADCTKAAVLEQAPGYSLLHFYGHGYFDPNDPLSSGLVLANEERLTLRDLQDPQQGRMMTDPHGPLASVRLLTLTACESGVPETQELPEEYLSLPAGFMQLGIPCVVSSLWPVPEVSSALLMGYFYAEIARGRPVGEALQRAQGRVAGLTYADLLSDEDFCRREDRETSEAWMEFYTTCVERSRTNPRGHPFAPAYYWGAFTVTGCA